MNKLPLYQVEIRVRGYEVDSLGHVNNAVYLNWLEHARWELSAGAPPLLADPSIMAVLRHAELDFQNETRLGDALRITTWPRRVGNTSMTLGARIDIVAATDGVRAGKTAMLATQVIVCVSRQGKVVPVPDGWRRTFPEQDPGPNLPGL